MSTMISTSEVSGASLVNESAAAKNAAVISTDVCVLSIAGQLLVGNRQAFKQRILDAIHEGHRKFVVDLSHCGYIDTAGLGVLVSIAKKIREAGGELVLAGLNDDLLTLLELSGIAPLFTIADTQARALQALGAA